MMGQQHSRQWDQQARRQGNVKEDGVLRNRRKVPVIEHRGSLRTVMEGASYSN